MKKTTAFLLKKYKEMSGDKKVRIALDWSKTVRMIYKDGQDTRKLQNGNRSSRAS